MLSKGKIKYCTLAALALLGTTTQVTSQQIILESSLGQSYVMEIAPENSFQEVIDSINSGLVIAESQSLDEVGMYPETAPDLTIDGFRMHIAANNAIMVKAVSKGHQGRNYNTPPTAQDKIDIAYIINTMANTNLLKIGSMESSLQKAGGRIDRVHPLQFLTYVFTEEELKVSMRNLQGRSFVWKGFLRGKDGKSGIVDTLQYEDGLGNVAPHAKHFANAIGIDVNLILPLMQNGKWEKFIDKLIEVVQRPASTGRYNM